jgi:glycosyltransferase involved in cell wall biosynthesis/putative flippase GtrA
MRIAQAIDELVEKIAGRKINKAFLQYFRYLLCGAVATVTDISILFVLTHVFRVNYLIAAAGAFLTGIIVNYTLNTVLVFKSSGRIKKEFPLFALIGIGGLVWTEIILWILVDKLDVYVMFAKAVAIVLVLQWNFFMRKRFVFSAENVLEDSIEKNIKILTIAATPFFSDRGCHIRILNGAKYLEKLGAKVKICTYFSGENVGGLDIERIGKVGWYKRTAPGFSWGKFWLDIKLIFLCQRVIRKFRPDIIHAHLYEGLGVGYIAKRLAFRSVPIVTDLQADLNEEFRNYNKNNHIVRQIFVWLSKRLVNRCDWLVVSSENVKPHMEKLFKHKNRITIIRDGVDLDLFRNLPGLSAEEEKNIEKIKKWKEDRKLLVYIGGLSDNKGVGQLLESFNEHRDQREDWRLLIGGFGGDEEKYKKFVRENDLGEDVFFAGKIIYFSLPAYLDLADASIDPKNGSTESSGKIVNLMAASLPIICFENEFNRSRLGEKGYYLKTFGELGSILKKIGTRERIGYDLEELGERKEIKKLFQIFKQLISKHENTSY